MLRIITDFDGPIMDVSERYYTAYQYCLEQTRRPDQAVRIMDKAEFWSLKRSRTPERKIGEMSGLDADQALAFSQLRRQTVHTLPYLAYDQPAPGAITALEKIQQSGAELVVMTMRRVSELQEAFTRCDLERFFPENVRYCLENDYVKTKDIEDKPLLMKRALAELSPVSQAWMVGDTEADIIAAKTHGVPVIAVLCGIRDRTQLEQYQPDYIVNTLSEAVDLIHQHSLTAPPSGKIG